MKRNDLFIDGTEDGLYMGASPRSTAPWAVFDATAQDWIASELRWRWQALLIKWWRGGGWGI